MLESANKQEWLSNGLVVNYFGI